MKLPILLLAFSLVLLSSCTTAYKTGQTPDDVYYSPARPQAEYAVVEDNDDRSYSGDEYYEDQYYEDRYLRMKVRNRRWSDLDDWYSYDRHYSYSYYNFQHWNNPWNSIYYWNNNYNPYCPPCNCVPGGKQPVRVVYNKPRTFNLNAFNGDNNPSRVTSPKTPRTGGILRTFGNTNRNSGTETRERNSGKSLRERFGGSSSNNSSSNNSISTPRTNTSTPSSSSSSSGKSGGSAPVRKF